MSVASPCFTAETIAQAELICGSYAKLLGEPLIAGQLTGRDLLESIERAPFVVVSHNTDDDPLFNFGNRAALQLWEMGWDEFVGLPSRYSAEQAHRGERERLLSDVAAQGFSRNYSGIRASKNGRRFRIERATVFNLLNARGEPAGQAATFSDWTYL